MELVSVLRENMRKLGKVLFACAGILLGCSEETPFSGLDEAVMISSGTSSSERSSAARTTVATISELGNCSAQNSGEQVFVEREAFFYACVKEYNLYAWKRIGGTSSVSCSSQEKSSSSSSSLVSSSSSADTTVSEIWNGKMKTPQTAYRNGAYYMVISSAEELAYFANQVTNIGKTNLNAYLTKDIRLNPEGIVDVSGNLLFDPSELREWTPIGSAELDHFYGGVFDGNGHTISGVYVNNSTAERVGFFATMENAQVKKLGVENSYIVGGKYVGGLVGRSKNANINQVYFDGFASGSNVGGIIGYQNGDSITNCYSKGKVYGTSRSAGISGYKQSGTLNACYTVSKVRGSGSVYAVTSNSKSTNCFYQTDYGVSEWTAETDKATEMSASAMKSTSFAQKLNVAAGDTYWIYNYNVNDGYPSLMK